MEYVNDSIDTLNDINKEKKRIEKLNDTYIRRFLLRSGHRCISIRGIEEIQVEFTQFLSEVLNASIAIASTYNRMSIYLSDVLEACHTLKLKVYGYENDMLCIHNPRHGIQEFHISEIIETQGGTCVPKPLGEEDTEERCDGSEVNLLEQGKMWLTSLSDNEESESSEDEWESGEDTGSEHSWSSEKEETQIEIKETQLPVTQISQEEYLESLQQAQDEVNKFTSNNTREDNAQTNDDDEIDTAFGIAKNFLHSNTDSAFEDEDAQWKLTSNPIYTFEGPSITLQDKSSTLEYIIPHDTFKHFLQDSNSGLPYIPYITTIALTALHHICEQNWHKKLLSEALRYKVYSFYLEDQLHQQNQMITNIQEIEERHEKELKEVQRNYEAKLANLRAQIEQENVPIIKSPIKSKLLDSDPVESSPINQHSKRKRGLQTLSDNALEQENYMSKRQQSNGI